MGVFKPSAKKVNKPAGNKGGQKAEPSAKVGKEMFIVSLLNVPFKVPNLTTDGDSTVRKDLIASLGRFEIQDLFDADSEAEMRTFTYVFEKFKRTIEYTKNDFFKQSGELFIAEIEGD